MGEVVSVRRRPPWKCRSHARRELARRLGRQEARLDCDPHIEPLRPVSIDVVQRDERLPGHQLRRSRDGSSWDELDAPPGFWSPHWAPEGACRSSRPRRRRALAGRPVELDQGHLRDAPTVRLRDSWFLL